MLLEKNQTRDVIRKKIRLEIRELNSFESSNNEVPGCSEDVNKNEVPTNVGRVLREATTFTKILVTGSGTPTDISSFSPL